VPTKTLTTRARMTDNLRRLLLGVRREHTALSAGLARARPRRKHTGSRCRLQVPVCRDLLQVEGTSVDETSCQLHGATYQGSMKLQNRIQEVEDANVRDDLVRQISSIPNEGNRGLSYSGIYSTICRVGVGEWPKRLQGILSPWWSNSAQQRSKFYSKTRSGVCFRQRVPETSSI
jgi:hypothetical protein